LVAATFSADNCAAAKEDANRAVAQTLPTNRENLGELINVSPNPFRVCQLWFLRKGLLALNRNGEYEQG
jgi:hypothetical protein